MTKRHFWQMIEMSIIGWDFLCRYNQRLTVISDTFLHLQDKRTDDIMSEDGYNSSEVKYQ